MREADTNKLTNKIKILESSIQGSESTFFSATSDLSHLTTSPIYGRIFNLFPSPIGITKIDDGTFYDVNDEFCRQTGFSREEVIGKTSTQLGFWPDDNRDKTVAALLRDGRYRNMQVNHRIKDGTVKKCINFAEMLTIGAERYAITIFHDITAYVEVSNELFRERGFNKAVIESLPGWFYVVDQSQKFILWNDNLRRSTGYSDEEIRAMRVADFNLKATENGLSEAMQHVFHRGEYAAEADVVLKDKTTRTFFFSSKRLNYKGANCIVGTAYDITHQKKAEHDLNRLTRSLEEANTALRVLMNSKDHDQKTMQDKLRANINDLVIPYLKKLKKSGLDNFQKKCLSELENNLSDVLSPFLTNFLSAHQNLTPHEIQIADLIRRGKGTKEIADILNASANTIATHRNNIRKKLNLRNAKINLRSHLQSLS